MSGLNDVLGNVYGTAEDKPQENTLEDVKDSMEALLDHADRSVDAPENETEEATAHVEAAAETMEQRFTAESPVESTWDEGEDLIAGDDDFLADVDDIDFGAEAEPSASIAEEPEVAAGLVDSLPDAGSSAADSDFDEFALVDDLFDPDGDSQGGFDEVEELSEDFFADLEPVSETSDDFAEPDDRREQAEAAATLATSEPAETDESLDVSSDWLQEVDVAEDGDSWLDEYGEEAEPVDSVPVDNSTKTIADSPDSGSSGSTEHFSLDDELSDFEFGLDDDGAESSGEPLPASPVDAADEDLLDESDEAWLDDLFSVDGVDTEPTESAGTSAEPVDTSSSHDEHQDSDFELEEIAFELEETSPAGVEASAAQLDAVETEGAEPASPAKDSAPRDPEPAAAAATQIPRPEAPAATAPAVEPQQESQPTFAIAYGGWARVDDDILPKKSGRSRGRKNKNDDIAVQIDTTQLDLADATYRSSSEVVAPTTLAQSLDQSSEQDDDLVNLFSPEEDKPRSSFFSRSKKPKSKGTKRGKDKAGDSDDALDQSEVEAADHGEAQLTAEQAFAAPGLVEAAEQAEASEGSKRSFSFSFGRKNKADDSAGDAHGDTLPVSDDAVPVSDDAVPVAYEATSTDEPAQADEPKRSKWARAKKDETPKKERAKKDKAPKKERAKKDKAPKKGISLGLGRKKKSDAEVEAELLAEVDAAEAATAHLAAQPQAAADALWQETAHAAPAQPLPEGVADPLEAALMKPPPSVEG